MSLEIFKGLFDKRQSNTEARDSGAFTKYFNGQCNVLDELIECARIVIQEKMNEGNSFYYDEELNLLFSKIKEGFLSKLETKEGIEYIAVSLYAFDIFSEFDHTFSNEFYELIKKKIKEAKEDIKFSNSLKFRLLASAEKMKDKEFLDYLYSMFDKPDDLFFIKTNNIIKYQTIEGKFKELDPFIRNLIKSSIDSAVFWKRTGQGDDELKKAIFRWGKFYFEELTEAAKKHFPTEFYEAWNSIFSKEFNEANFKAELMLYEKKINSCRD
ncbi:MAG: hypothetical protein WC356_02970 [Candidatus Micrarchaeia archaeon]|jgi:hypothetical protein